MTAALPKTIRPSKIIFTENSSVGVAPATLPEHRAEFWYVAIAGSSGEWETKSMIRVVTKNGQNLETEVKAWAARDTLSATRKSVVQSVG